MPTFVVLLRGVNVGRGNRVPMAEFRLHLESLGYTGVRTLLNSGNAVFASSKPSPAAHAAAIRSVLASHLAVDVPVIVKSSQEFKAVNSENSLASDEIDHSRLLVVFRQDSTTIQELAVLEPLVRPPERWHLGRHAAYLFCASGILESKAAHALLGKADVSSTTRNWATVLKLGALLRGHRPPL